MSSRRGSKNSSACALCCHSQNIKNSELGRQPRGRQTATYEWRYGPCARRWLATWYRDGELEKWTNKGTLDDSGSHRLAARRYQSSGVDLNANAPACHSPEQSSAFAITTVSHTHWAAQPDRFAANRLWGQASQKKKKLKIKCSNLSVIRRKRGEEVGCFAHVKPTKLPLTMGMINIYTCPGAFTFTMLQKAAAMGLKGSRRASIRGTSEKITAALPWRGALKKCWYLLASWLAYVNVLFTCYNPDA